MRLPLILSILALIVLAGCKKGEDANTPVEQPATGVPKTTTTPPSTASAGSPAPMGSGMAGGMTPMANTQSVEGAGGGSTAMAAKEMAKRKISQSGSTANQMPADENGQ